MDIARMTYGTEWQGSKWEKRGAFIAGVMCKLIMKLHVNTQNKVQNCSADTYTGHSPDQLVNAGI